MNDLVFAVRMQLKNPGFTVAAVLALGLGIGANTAIFSVVNKVLLSPLPFKDPNSLVMVWSTALANKIDKSSVSGPDFVDWRTRNRSFESMAAADIGCRFNLAGRGRPVVLKGAYVTPDLFGVFGIPINLGRALRAEDAEPGNERRLVLSHALWQRQFGGDTNVVGQTLTVNGQPHEVVGVAEPGMGFVEDLIEAYAPMSNIVLNRHRMNHSFLAFGRLKPGVTKEQATDDLNAICAALEQEYPDQKGWRVYMRSLHEELVQPVRTAFLVLHGAVALVLLIACGNVASLLLARAEARSKEMAIRASLGANRGRVIKQLLTESSLLGLAGGALGLLLARVGIAFLIEAAPKVDGRSIPLFAEVGLDGRVLAFTLVVAILTGVLFGLAPAWHASKVNLADTLKEGGRGGALGRKHHRWLQAFVVGQVALSVVLLCGAGLMIRSLQKLSRVWPGFEPANLLTMQMELPESRYTNRQMCADFYREVIRRIEVLPAVENVGVVNHLAMDNSNSNNAFEIEGEPPLPKGRYNLAEYRLVNHDYFRAMRMPIKQGRSFTSQDNESSPPVMIVNERMAATYFPKTNPIGRRVKYLGDRTFGEIVGVVGDEKCFGLGRANPPMIYRPYRQDCWQMMSVVVKTRVSPMSLAEAVRDEIQAVDSEQPIAKVRPMNDLVTESISVQRFSSLLLSASAATGLLLAAIGIYGVLAYVISQRTHEVGVRVALGARVGDILSLVLRQGLRLTGLGMVIGVAVSVGASRVVRGLLFEVTPSDPITYAFVIVALAAVACLASYLPARKAARVDPVVALRYE